MSTTDPATYEAPPPRPAAQPPYASYPVPPAPQLSDPRTKSPAVAGVLSFLIPGLGQVYVGYYPRGFMNIVVIAGIVSILANAHEEAFVPLLALFMVFYWFYNVIDAARLAALFNQVLAGGREPALPDGFKLPGIGGSILGGGILIAAGFAVLLHTRWGVRLDWVQEWWPVFPMLFGAYLVGKAIIERGRGGEGA